MPIIIGTSPRFLETMSVAKRVAASSANILITGESGTGKEIIAKLIHEESKHRKGAMISINCSAIPENLLESELFGHVKGAFTGAQTTKVGLFEVAENGTLFLDEISDLPLSLQAKLLRVLQERKIRRVGENHFRTINCRIVSATHKDLTKEVESGRFRDDLYFRLNVIPIHVPPLRERPEDLLPLVESFLARFASATNVPLRTFSPSAKEFICHNRWRGNVRELENAVERAVVLSSNAMISVDDIKSTLPTLNSMLDEEDHSNTDLFRIHGDNQLPTLAEIVNAYVIFAVQRNGGARDKTAREIGIDRKTLYRHLKSQIYSERGGNTHHEDMNNSLSQ